MTRPADRRREPAGCRRFERSGAGGAGQALALKTRTSYDAGRDFIPVTTRTVEQYGIVVDFRGRKDFAKLLAAENNSLGKILKELGVQPQ